PHLHPDPEPVTFRMNRAGFAARDIAEEREDTLEIAEADSAPGRCFNQNPDVAKNEPAILGGHRAFAAEAQMEALDCFSTKKEQRGEEQEKERGGHRDSGGGPFPQREPREPGRDADDEDENSGAGKVENKCGDEDADAGQPDDPALVSAAEIVLHATENDERRDSKKVAGLVAIRIRTKA